MSLNTFEGSSDGLLLHDRPAGRANAWVALCVGVLPLVTAVATLPWRRLPVQRFDAFIPAVETALFLGYAITAALLFSQAAVARSRGLAILGGGYLLTGLLLVAHELTFPGAFAPTGLLGGGVNTTVWLYYFVHAGLPLAVIGYSLARRRERAGFAGDPSSLAWIASAVAAAALLAAVLVVVATAGHAYLPPMMSTDLEWSRSSILPVLAVLIVLVIAAMAALSRAGRSLLNLWLMVTLTALLIKLALNAVTPGRFTVGWYAGRLAELFSGLAVLFVLLFETGRLYARLALATMAQRQERESRLMSMDVMAAAIAHEVRQPLTAIVANAGAAALWLDRPEPRVGEARKLLGAVADEGRRASDIITSIRAMIAPEGSERRAADLNALVRETAAMVAGPLAAVRAGLHLDLHEALPEVVVDRLQMRQVLLNLLGNAIEALAASPRGRRRVIVLRTREGEGLVMLEVEDSGVGLPPESGDRLFEPFFTTKAGGTGTGLALCRSIVTSHGGEISAREATGQGAVFRIALPVTGGA